MRQVRLLGRSLQDQHAGRHDCFEAETESARYGKLLWKGTVRGEKLDATVMSIRDGKSPVENWVVAAEKK